LKSNFGEVKVARVRTSGGLKKLIRGIVPDSDVYLIKPNWYSPLKGGYTDAKSLDLLLSALPGRKIVVEGYSIDRQDGSIVYNFKGTKVDWSWLLKSPDSDWLHGTNLETMRLQDRWFRDTLGLSKILEKYNAEYLSITEEVLAGRVEPIQDVKNRVQHQKLYGYMPSSLAELAGAPLISFGHIKGYGGNFPSLSLKNMFGLIPDPLRSWWHGPTDNQLSQSIVDTTKLYATYFPLIGIMEAISSYTIPDPEGEVKTPWGAYRIGKGGGFVACGKSLVELDAIVSGLIKVDTAKVGYLSLAEQVFGEYPRDAVTLASKYSTEWFAGT
jgi:hypothetical protein